MVKIMGDEEEVSTYQDTAEALIPSEPIPSLKDKMCPFKFQFYGDKYLDIEDFESTLCHDDAYMIQAGLYSDKDLHYMFGNISDFHTLLTLLQTQRMQSLLL